MLINYIRIATRTIIKQRGYTLVNIFGLTISLTVSMIILLWIQDEIGMDSFHQDKDRLYRVLCNEYSGQTDVNTLNSSPYPLIQYLSENYPEVEEICAYDPTNKKSFQVLDKNFLEDGLYATADFFKTLTFPLIQGAADKIFQEPKSIAISHELAAKLYGTEKMENIIGQTVQINGEPDFKITGIFRDVPRSSSLSFHFVLSLEELQQSTPNPYPWENFDSRVVFKLKKDVSATGFAQKIGNVITINSENTGNVKVILQSFGRMYLHGQFENGEEAGGRIEYVRLFALAVIFLLLIACINFMNLSTALASTRVKEIGVRKVIGASRRSLMAQFLTETALIATLSMVFAIVLAAILFPSFEVISGKELSLNFNDPSLWGLIVGVGIITIFFAGSYPAFFLSALRTSRGLKGQISRGLGSAVIRRGLVIFQFALSALLVVSAMVVRNQVRYIENKNLGLDKSNILYFRTPPGADERMVAFKSELSRIPGITNITLANTNPLSVGSQTGNLIWEGMASEENFIFNILRTDHNFLNTLNVPLVRGRNFSELLRSDTSSFIINEVAAKTMGMEDPIGKILKYREISGPIIGVVNDFHISSLYENIGPLIIANLPQFTRLTMLRIDPGHNEEVLASLGETFAAFSEGVPFRYDFLDERYMQMYRNEQRTGSIAWWFALVAMIISCLGLLGLSAFVAEQKTKEIGIRKVLGASIYNVVMMLSLKFLRWVVLALLLALPLSWMLMESWLTRFAYRIGLSWWIFLVTGGIIIGLALITVGVLSLKAALANPAESLQNE